MRHVGPILSRQRLGALVGLGLMAIAAGADTALAQRPFALHDPFYRGETGRRSFYDGYALTTELSYRTQGEAIRTDPLGLSFRAEYQLAPSLDVGAVIDASGGTAGRSLTVSWLTLKYYATEENTDRALRLAVDPAVDGRLGNPQVDLAFISTTLLKPNLSADYAFGVRRVRVGYEQLVDAPMDGAPPAPPEQPGGSEIVFTRALGWEMHFMSQYSFILNPARNSFFLSGLVYLGDYDMVESSLREEQAAEAGMLSESSGAPATGGRPVPEEYRAGAVWLRAGIEYNRPAFQVAPFASFALKQWMPSEGHRPARLSFGLRFMVR